MRRKPVILMIEADSYYAEICARHFSVHGFQTKIVKNFIEADKKIKRSLPEIIIIDIALEEKAGLTWIKTFRQGENHQMLPVVVLTGLGDREEIRAALQNGVNKFFLKSQITPHELAEQIEHL